MKTTTKITIIQWKTFIWRVRIYGRSRINDGRCPEHFLLYMTYFVTDIWRTLLYSGKCPGTNVRHGRLSRVLRPSIEVIFVEIRLSPTSNEKLIYWLDFRWWECHCDFPPIRHRNIVLIHKTHRTVPRIDTTNYSFHSQMWFSVRMCRFLSED